MKIKHPIWLKLSALAIVIAGGFAIKDTVAQLNPGFYADPVGVVHFFNSGATPPVVGGCAAPANCQVGQGSSLALNGAISPGGAAGGDLGGTYPNPTVINGSHIGAGTVPIASITGILPAAQGGSAINNTGSLNFNGAAGVVNCVPNKQVFTSGSNATYTTPTCAGALPLYLDLWLVGSGAGGNGGGTTPGAGGAGNQSCFKASTTACTTPLFNAAGGAAGSVGAPNIGGVGAGVNGGGATGTCDADSFSGGTGQGGDTATAASGAVGGAGGTGYLGGAAQNNSRTGAGGVGVNGGGGAGGSANSVAADSGGGGGGGGSCHATVTTPIASYFYTIGAAGTAGTLGTSGQAGGAGGAGQLIVVARWQ